MKHFLVAAVTALCLLLGACSWGRRGDDANGAPYPELELVTALPVDVPDPLEPSGLTLTPNGLFTVADKDDRTLYRVETDGKSAKMVAAIRFTPPGRGYMDWEGIASDPQGNFYLVSEEQSRICRVTPEGKASWVSPDLRELTNGSGLFAKSNAGLEGIAWLGPDHWLGAVEREPRGLVEFDGKAVQAQEMEHSPFSDALPLIRLPDYSGLAMDNGKVFALFRNAHLVVQLERIEGQWEEVAAWSYRHIETDPRWAFRAQTYGQAEGLVVRGGELFLIFDNNLGGRQADRNDGRPLLVHARFPAGD